MILIGLVGDAGAGKGEAAQYLEKKYGFVKLSFADPLREGVKAFFGFTDQHFIDRELKENVDSFWGISPRFALQKMGTEVMRNMFHPNFWVKRMTQRVGEIVGNNPTARIVIDDVRFENELDFVLAFKGLSCRIERSNNPNKISSSHASESVSQTLQCEHLIENNGSLQDLRNNLDRFMFVQCSLIPIKSTTINRRLYSQPQANVAHGLLSCHKCCRSFFSDKFAVVDDIAICKNCLLELL